MRLRARSRRSALITSPLLAGVLIFSILLTGCRGAARPLATATALPTLAAAAEKTATPTPAPTRTPRETLPPTWTPTAPRLALEPTATPTATATPHNQKTLSAQATFDSSTKCVKRADAWQLIVRASWKGGWCEAIGQPGTYYEYRLWFPQEWEVNTFGELYPNMVFIVPQKGVELRLYSVFNYETKKFYGKLEDAPQQAFCDKTEKCIPIMDSTETITQKQTRAMGQYQVLILDSTDGRQYIRRYFFQVYYKDVMPQVNRLFFFKLYTPQPYSDKLYQPIQDLIEDVLDSVKPRVEDYIPNP